MSNSTFKLLKQQVDLREIISEVEGIEVVACGDNTYELANKECPFCGHRDCFRIKHDETDPESSIYKCFSGGCEATGDAVKYVSSRKDFSTWESVKYLSNKYKIHLSLDITPIQQVMDMAAAFYKEGLYTDKKYPELNNLTPFEYQTQVRGHSNATLDSCSVGWSDSDLVSYLLSVGVDKELITESGLCSSRDPNKDFFPRKCFIYPHFINGRASHFTFKDPTKRLHYQLPNKHKLNGHRFYGQDSTVGKHRVIIVEGENDLLSIVDAGWREGVISSIGSLSKEQIIWCTEHLQDKEVITMFDPDEAGDGYRSKMNKIRGNFLHLTQIKPSEVNDVDECLRSGISLDDLLDRIVESDAGSTAKDGSKISDSEVHKATGIVEKNRCYYRMKFNADGNIVPTKLTNFVVRLRNIFIHNARREREVILERYDGKHSAPLLITSESKVSLKAFKAIVANAVDATFYGTEADMSSMWDYIYDVSKEREVLLPSEVGRVQDIRGWLFQNCFVTEAGSILKPDREDVIWIKENESGLKAIDLNIDAEDSSSSNSSIPRMTISCTKGEVENMEEVFVRNLALNIGCVGTACILIGWVKSNVYSDYIFHKWGSFPFLLFWGRHGRGKTKIIKWLLGLLGMEDKGYSTMSRYKSGVGFGRKIAYYGSLPVTIDEIRDDREARELYGTIRGWWNRAGRDMGVKEAFGIKHIGVRSNFIFGGQDLFTDAATLQRCIPVILPSANREMVVSYEAIESMRDNLSAIGFGWILQSSYTDTRNRLLSRIAEVDEILRNSKVDSRNAKNWSMVVPFAEDICSKYFPEYDMVEFSVNKAVQDCKQQEEEDIVSKFFSRLEILQTSQNSPITEEDIRVKEDGTLFIWSESVLSKVIESVRDASNSFSKKALEAAIKEESWCVEYSCKTVMCVGGAQRRAMKLAYTLENSPEVLKRIADTQSRLSCRDGTGTF